MRHGETQNNLLHRISVEAYNQHRSYEPELSEDGARDSQRLGKAMSEAGFALDVILTSAHKRAILSAKHVIESYPDIPVHLMVNIHEVEGVHMKGKCYPGLNMVQAKELLPQLQISAAEAAIFGNESDGWYKREKPETS